MSDVRIRAVTAIGGCDQIGCQQDPEGVGELGLGTAVLTDQEALEDGLIELATDLSRRIQVRAVAVGEEGEAAFKGRLDRGELDFRSLEQCLCDGEFSPDPVLLALEEIEWDRACVVGLEELPPLLLEVADAVR